MAVLLGVHLLVAVACAALGRRLGAQVFAVGALAPAVAFGWLCATGGAVLGGEEQRQSWVWAGTLGLAVPLRLDGLALLLGLIITGVGTAVLLYAVRYFAHRRHGLGRFSALLVLFAGAMLALVLVDNLLALYVAWELTTICSFLLIGDDGKTKPERRAALRALLITTGAGFPMLLGLLLLGHAGGSYQISTLLASPPHGGQVTAALVLILVGAFAKSAQVPFHTWLPAAMVAATPVSAYLHAAAMVKAGVYLVARLAPGVAELLPWRPLVIAVGLASMLLGGWRALAQTDLKRLLAFGTIAQLGFLLVLVGAGTRTAALAGAAMLLGHALFKGSLFLVVGIIDHQAGTRDLRELAGVRRHSPVLAGLALLACASMAGLPLTAGYLGKEAAFEAFVEPGPGHGWVLAGLVVGSALTVAYTVRFWWGAFLHPRRSWTYPGEFPANRPTRLPDPLHQLQDRRVEDRRAGVWLVPVAALAVGGVALGLTPGFTDRLSGGYARVYPETEPYHLALWHGVGPPLLLSLLTLAAGVVLHLARDPVARFRLPDRFGVAELEDRLAGVAVAVARGFTARTQVGSLPAYLLVILAVVALGPGLVLAFQVGVPAQLRPWDHLGQLGFGAGVVIGVAALVATRRRWAAVLLLSAVGYLVAGVFVVHGAPDLALAQVLVETLTLLVLVLVVRRMPAANQVRAMPLRRVRAGVAVLVGLFAAAAVYTAGAHHRPSRSIEGYFQEAPEAAGHNVVNAIVTEFRALDTVGEVTVLAIAATGVASLVLVSRRTGGPPRPGRTRQETEEVSS